MGRTRRRPGWILPAAHDGRRATAFGRDLHGASWLSGACPKGQRPACPKVQLEHRAARRYVPAMTRSGPSGHGQGQPFTDEAPLVAIVDDDASVRQSTRRLIRSFGYRAETYASGEEFLASVSTARAACLVLDVRVPGMDGLEVQRRLAARGARMPIVFLTGRASDNEEIRARSAGAIEFLRKPVGKVTLLQVLEKVFHVPQRVRGNGDDH